MGIPAQSVASRRRRRARRRGIALPSAMLALVALSLLAGGLFLVADLNAKAIRNREDAARAMHVAEAGLAHALALGRGPLLSYSKTRLLRGFDNLANTPDDGMFIGYGLVLGDQIPSTGRSFGGGTYFVSMEDDPADPVADVKTDGNRQILLRCRSVMSSGASAEIQAVVRTVTLPGIAVDGNLEISGKPALLGPCGGIHANGNMSGGGLPTVTTAATATGSITVNVTPKQASQPYLDIPNMNPADYCSSANYFITSSLWKPSAAALNPGIYCVTGNVELGVDFGSPTNMRSVTIIATGSIKVPAKPHIKAAHPDGILLLAGGDIDLQGDWVGEGLIYGGGQCYVSAKPTIVGQLVCKNKSPHPGENWVPHNLISGDAKITFDCFGMLNQRWRVVSWFRTVGS